MLNEGQVVERFTVEARLGEGGMAEVYRVRHNALGSLHALKLLKVQGESIRRRLVTEGQVQAVLRHPNVVAVTDVVFIGEQPGLVMELIEGPTLEDWLAEYQPTMDEAEALFKGVLAGVTRAHRAGLVHRDLKPGNVLLDQSEGVVVPKVTDFGLAKVLDGDESLSMTRSGVAMGTPQYMAPEQIRNAKDVDQRADIWALGCILYQLVCGRRPFDTADIIELYGQIGKADYPAPRSIVPELPLHLEQAIEGCLVADREGRIGDCDALRQLLTGTSPEEGVPGGVGRLVGAITRAQAARATRPVPAETYSPSLMPMGAATTMATMGEQSAPSAPTPQPTFATRDVAPPAPVAQKRALPLWIPVLGGLAVLLAGAGATLLWLAFMAREPSTEPEPPAATSPATVPATAPTAPAATATKANEARANEGKASAPSPEKAEPTPTAPSAGASTSTEAPREPPSARAGRDPERLPTAPVGSGAVALPATTPTGMVVVTGDAERVSLRSGSRSLRPGAVPVGTYTPVVTFAGGDPIELESFNIEENQTVTLSCDSTFAKCKIR